MLIYFVGPKHPSVNCYVRCFLTDRTALVKTHHKSKAVLSVGKQLTQQLPEGCFGPTKNDNSGTFTQIYL